MSDPTPRSQEDAEELLVSRRFLFDAVESVTSSDSVAIRRAILLADLASESLLKLVLRRLGGEVQENWKFPQLLDAVRAAHKPGTLTYLGDPLRLLRKMRNGVMHDGLGQEPVAARRAISKARTALSRLVRDTLNVDLDTMSVTQFIRSPWVRYLLTEAMKRYLANEYGQAAAIADRAFFVLLQIWRKFVEGLFELKGEKSTAQIIAVLSSGAHLPDLSRFREATKGAQANVSLNGTICVSFKSFRWAEGHLTSKEVEDARYALDFVGSMALQIEGRFPGELPRPFAGDPPATSHRA